MLRILVVARLYPSADQPGRGSFVADLVGALVAAGHEIVVASFETVQLRGADATKAERAHVVATAWAAAVAEEDVLCRPHSWGAGVPVARLPAIRTWGSGSELDEADQIARHAEILLPFGRALDRRWPIDVVHAQTGVPDGLAADRLATELDLPLVVSEHDSTLPGRLATDERLARRYRELVDPARGRAVAVVSPALDERIRAHLGGTAALATLPNPISIDAFGRGDPTDRDPDELLWVGMLAEHKGTPLLLAAFAEARRRRPGFRLRLIGPSANEDVDRWRGVARDLGIIDAVTFEPRADRAAVADAMRRASIFVHPSPWETFGVVAAEAIASGLPVAATPSGGVEWIVGRDGRLGQIAATSDAASLAVAIVAVDARRSTFDARVMLAEIEGRFAPKRVASGAEALYERVLADMPARSARGEPIRPPAAPASPGMATTLVSRPLIVVGLHASALARLAALPAGAIAGTTVVTAPGPWVRTNDPPARRFELDAPAAYRRRIAEVGGLLGRLRRRRLAGARPEIEAAERARVLKLAVEATGDPAGGRPRAVAVDADDAAAMLDGVGQAATLAPGSLRWLADRHDATDDPMPAR